ncbi:hypothetical protein [Eremococcus coleocola]|uniref:hypothetical protein n=1 Tax=Eremococcus coleocola TaxID=88132 RepID=UPI00041509D0|nr:hypothetical protein [Eremococcus coleocola]
MTYTVIHAFRDLEDINASNPDGRVYMPGDTFPATKRRVAKARIEELSTDKNKIGKPLIEAVK